MALPLYGISALAGLGYYLNQDKRIRKEKIERDMIHPHEKPSGHDIFNSRYLENVQAEVLTRNTLKYKESLSFPKSNTLPPAYKDRQDVNVARRRGQISGKVVQKEEDVASQTSKTSTRRPSASQSVFVNHNELPNKQYTIDMGTTKFNAKRRRMFPLNYKQDDSTGGWSPITKISTGYNADKQQSTRIIKNPKVYEFGHNNMEPFFGSSIKQNLDPFAHRSRLEAFTGTEPVYNHKKEVKRFFPLERNPFVNGLPVQKNRELDRYIPALDKNNVLPFEQIRVAPGLNQDPSVTTSSIGFHDTYRPKFKTVNELRVNPKNTYLGRIIGKKDYISQGELPVKVISRQPVDLSYSNFKQDSKLLNKRYRGLQKDSHGGVAKPQILDQKTIVLKIAERDQYGHRIAKLHGHGDATQSGQRQTTQFFDSAKQIIKTTTEYNPYQRINPGAGDNNIQGTRQFYDEAKHITKESTEYNPYQRINPAPGDNNKKGIAYDKEAWKAKTTLKQQTENAIYSHINAKPQDQGLETVYDPELWKAKMTIRETTADRYYAPIVAAANRPKGITQFFDRAQTTQKEQTLVEDYVGIMGIGAGGDRQMGRVGMYNAEINALKELTLPGREPAQQGVKVIPDKNWYKIETKKQQFDTYNKTKRITKSWVPTSGLQPEITTQKKKYCDHDFLKSRIEPWVVEQFTKNPYTQSLQSFIIPYNPAFPQRENKPSIPMKSAPKRNRYP